MAKHVRRGDTSTALLKVGADASDSEFVRAFRTWLYLFTKQLPRIVFERTPGQENFRSEVLDAQSLRKDGIYLIVDAVAGTFMGIAKGVKVRAMGGKRPVPGRVYHLVKMGQT